MKYEVKREDVYIPAWNGNRELPADEQIKVFHRYLTAEERGRFFYTKPVDLSQKVDERKIEYVQNVEGAAKALIQKIENFIVSIDGKDKEITSAAKLYGTPGIDEVLVGEIESHLRFITPEVDKGPLS